MTIKQANRKAEEIEEGNESDNVQTNIKQHQLK